MSFPLAALPLLRRPALVVRRFFFLPPLVLALLITTGCVTSSEVREESFDLGDSPTLVIRNENGDIEVRAGNGRTIEVESTLKNPGLVEYNVRQMDGRLEIDARGRRNSILDHVLFWRSSAAVVVVTVPVNTEIDLQASNGKIALEGVSRGGYMRTSNGSITIEDVLGFYEARTSNGPVTVTSLRGEANIQTSNGPVVLTDVYGRFDVGTSNGSISLSGFLTGRTRLTTSNGDVEVTFDGQRDLALNATTSNGRITSRLQITPVDESTGRLVAMMGAGATELTISTSNGSIMLQESSQ
jgi:hypothetical protein